MESYKLLLYLINDDAKDYYDNTLKKAVDCEDERPKANAFCNIIYLLLY